MSAAKESGPALWRKLGVKPGGRLLLLDAPTGWSAGALPAGASETAVWIDAEALEALPGGQAHDWPAPGRRGDALDVTIRFVRARAELAGAIGPLARAIFPAGALWVAWPRRAAGHNSDLGGQDVRDLALPLGIVDVKVAALDQDWSGLRLVWRKERRGG